MELLDRVQLSYDTSDDDVKDITEGRYILNIHCNYEGLCSMRIYAIAQFAVSTNSNRKEVS